MNDTLSTPYILFYPTLSSDGMEFPINRAIRYMQGDTFVKKDAWRGDVVVAKYTDKTYSKMMDISIGDFAILKNYFARPPSSIDTQ